jgi:ketosteroid isomerase-like protein
MSHENVDLVLAATDAFNAGDIDWLTEFCARDIEVFPDASAFPEAGPVHGRVEYGRWAEDVASAWTHVGWNIEERFAVGDDRVIQRGEWGGEGTASGIRATSSITGIFTIRDGQITRIDFFFDHGQALKAAGLEE